MDQIAQQLQSEIDSLEEHIEQTGHRMLASHWIDEMIDPFEQLEEGLEGDDLRTCILAFHKARTHFRVNGHLADRIDGILARHVDLVEEFRGDEAQPAPLKPYDDVVLPPAADPDDHTAADDAGTLFAADDEELDGYDDPPHLPAFDEDEVTFEFADDSGNDAAEETSADDLFDAGGQATPEDGPVPGAPAEMPSADEEDGSLSVGDFPFDEETDEGTGDDGPAPAPLIDGDADDLFDTTSETKEASLSGQAAQDFERESTLDQRERAARAVKDASLSGQAAQDFRRESTLGRRERPEEDEPQALVDIFAQRIDIDDMAAALDLTLSAQERTLLEQKLNARLSDRVVAALRRNPAMAQQYILMPRLSTLRGPDGSSQGMTVKTMAKRYIGLFGDIRDLMRYRNDGMMSREVPEMGWAVITAEAPRESLGKNYMEQNQYLRQLSTSLSIPSHLVRRRTMVEAVWDLIVGKLVLGQQFQHATVDWTSSSPAKNDYVCVYFPDEGLRVRDLSRVTHHRSLGITPTW